MKQQAFVFCLTSDPAAAIAIKAMKATRLLIFSTLKITLLKGAYKCLLNSENSEWVCRLLIHGILVFSHTTTDDFQRCKRDKITIAAIAHGLRLSCRLKKEYLHLRKNPSPEARRYIVKGTSSRHSPLSYNIYE